ncbi:MAG: DUF3848 domain-containing protein [Oscillospiraceae bacterium]|nr:DUF3848 domain-containing protein [Oscillospiraceae bacterium]
MEQKDTIKDLLYEKMNNEQNDFVENLKHLPPEKIIQSAYEKVMRDDILMLFEDDFLDDKQIKALLRLERPLSACYDEWLKNDCSYMDMLRDTVDDFFKRPCKRTRKGKKEKTIRAGTVIHANQSAHMAGFLIQKFMKDEVIKNENKTVHGNGGNKGNSQILRSCELCQRSRRIYLQGCGKHRYFAYGFIGGQRSYHTSCRLR